jgi:hypothetical protein
LPGPLFCPRQRRFLVSGDACGVVDCAPTERRRKHLPRSFPPSSRSISSSGSNGAKRRPKWRTSCFRTGSWLIGRRGARAQSQARPRVRVANAAPCSPNRPSRYPRTISRTPRRASPNSSDPRPPTGGLHCFREVLDRELVAERRPQALDIVDLLDEGAGLTADRRRSSRRPPPVSASLWSAPPWIGLPAHADRSLPVLPPRSIGDRGRVLDAADGTVDEAQALRATGGDRHVERLDRQATFRDDRRASGRPGRRRRRADRRRRTNRTALPAPFCFRRHFT